MLNKKNILILAYASLNLGDDLFIKILCDRYPTTNFFIVSDRKFKGAFSEIENLSVISQIPFIDGLMNKFKIPFQFNGLNQIMSAKRMDGIVQIGGSIFIQNNNWKGRYGFLDRLANLNIPYFVIGSNFGPYSNSEFYEAYNTLFDKLDDICFRDMYSYNLFKDKKNVRIAPDVIFGIKHKPEYKKINESKDTVVISVIDNENRSELEQFTTKYEKLITDLAQRLLNEDKRVILMSFCKQEGDLKAIYRIKSSINDNNLEIYDYDGNMSEALNIINSSVAVVATRFHSLILGLVFNKRVFPLVYSNKTLNLLNDINFKGSFAKISSLDMINVDTIIDQLNSGTIQSVNKYNSQAEEQFNATDAFLE